jgi:hypothetical protein
MNFQFQDEVQNNLQSLVLSIIVNFRYSPLEALLLGKTPAAQKCAELSTLTLAHYTLPPHQVIALTTVSQSGPK